MLDSHKTMEVTMSCMHSAFVYSSGVTIITVGNVLCNIKNHKTKQENELEYGLLIAYILKSQHVPWTSFGTFWLGPVQ